MITTALLVTGAALGSAAVEQSGSNSTGLLLGIAAIISSVAGLVGTLATLLKARDDSDRKRRRR